MKNTILATLKKFILFIGNTFGGRNHDYSMLKQESPPEYDWFEDIAVLVDLGYQGIQNDYKGERIVLPCKKPRKSKKNPVTLLTPEQKTVNRALGRLRIFVENAIGGIKRYNTCAPVVWGILVHHFRNHKAGFVDDVIANSAALWNFSLSYH